MSSPWILKHLWGPKYRASLVAQMVKNLPAMWETWFLFLGRDSPEKGMAAQTSIPAWRIPRTEEPGGLRSMQSQSNVAEGPTPQAQVGWERGREETHLSQTLLHSGLVVPGTRVNLPNSVPGFGDW